MNNSRIDSIVASNYRVLRHLGSGGMGDVYEVEHLRLGRCFAAKFLRYERCNDRSAVERFEREAQSMAMLRSAHVASIVDSGQDAQGIPFFVMERLYGNDLRQLLLRYGSLSVARATRLLVDAALGLRAVHEAGLLHGDVKPGNLFVVSDDRGADVCKVLDFGLARTRTASAERKAMEAGTVRYMAPEQLVDGGVVDHRTDIRALGAVLYECIAGRAPHGGDKIERVMYSIMHGTPTPLSELGIIVPRGLEAAIMRALAVNPAERFASANSFIDAISPFAAGHPSSSSAPPRSETEDQTDESLTFPVPIVVAHTPTFHRVATLLLGALAGGIGVGVAMLPTQQATTAPKGDRNHLGVAALADRAAEPGGTASTPSQTKRSTAAAGAVLADRPVPPPAAPVAPSEALASKHALPSPERRAAPDPRRQQSHRAPGLGEFDTTSPYEIGER